MGQKEAFERIVFGKEPAKLPPVLNAEELVSFLEAVTGLHNRVALTTAYAAGLRVGEVARLKVPSIDSERMLILIENGKGGKDRYAMLSPRLLEILRAYWRRVGRGGDWRANSNALLSLTAARPSGVCPGALRRHGRGGDRRETPRAAQTMVSELGREITGRGRYRARGIL